MHLRIIITGESRLLEMNVSKDWYGLHEKVDFNTLVTAFQQFSVAGIERGAIPHSTADYLQMSEDVLGCNND